MTTFPVPITNSWLTDVTIQQNLASQFDALLAAADASAQETSQDAALAPLVHTFTEFAAFSQDYQAHFMRRPVVEQARALEKVQREWLALQPLLAQRRNPALRDRLNVADQFANSCAQRVGLSVADGGCLTYFEKTTSIARFVYSRAPALSIPRADVDFPWLWLGLGHELGHYYYWNTADLKEQWEKEVLMVLSQKLLASSASLERDAAIELLSFWHEWLEEIFADLFGALMLGPAYIESLMLWLCQRNTVETIFNNDHDHPLAFLRPLIQAATLRVTSQLHDECSAIEQTWYDYWGSQPGIGKWDERQVGKSQVKDYVALIPDLAETAARVIKAKAYTSDDHGIVLQVAKQLADGQQPDKSMDFALRFPTGWYAWRRILTQKTRVQHRRLATLSDWMAQQPSSTTSPAQGQLAPTRKTLAAWIRTLGKLDDNEKAKRLLAEEFSQPEELDSTYQYCAGCQRSHYHRW